MAQLVGRPTSAQVVISQFVGLSPVSDSVLTAQSLEPSWNSVSPSLSAPLLLMLCLCLSKTNKHLGRLGGLVGWASNFGSGHDLMVREFGPDSGSVLTAHSLDPASNSVSPSLSLCPDPTHALSLSQN